jgi:hypothetical protein
VLVPDRMGIDATLVLVASESVDWVGWGTAHGLLK